MNEPRDTIGTRLVALLSHLIADFINLICPSFGNERGRQLRPPHMEGATAPLKGLVLSVPFVDRPQYFGRGSPFLQSRVDEDAALIQRFNSISCAMVYQLDTSHHGANRLQ
jgi:hypothetical protein